MTLPVLMVVRIFRKNKTNMTGVIELIIFIKKHRYAELEINCKA